MKTTITGLNPYSGLAQDITFENGVISSVSASNSTPTNYIGAGLIDLQVNGHGGYDFNTETVSTDTIIKASKVLASLGVTTYLPTIITGSEERIIAALKSIVAARAADKTAYDMIAGVHVEGPNISPVDGPRGAHELIHVRAPSIAEFDRWQAAAEGLVSFITLAPEHDNAIEYIRYVSGIGVHVALGHTNATPEQIHAAAEAGATLSTHLGNGSAALIQRHPNYIWAQLSDDRLTATFIADSHHLPADTFKAMLRAKSLERAVLISDAVALAGMAPGLYEQPVGGSVEVHANGRINLAGTTYLGGAGMPLKDGVALAIKMAGITLGESYKLATENAGRFASNRGQLTVGNRADIIVFDWTEGDNTLQIQSTWVNGEQIV